MLEYDLLNQFKALYFVVLWSWFTNFHKAQFRPYLEWEEEKNVIRLSCWWENGKERICRISRQEQIKSWDIVYMQAQSRIYPLISQVTIWLYYISLDRQLRWIDDDGMWTCCTGAYRWVRQLRGPLRNLGNLLGRGGDANKDYNRFNWATREDTQLLIKFKIIFRLELINKYF